MKTIIVNFFKGIVIGVGKIVPGVSGAMIAISLGVYEKGLDSLNNLNKKNIKFLLNIGIGIIVSIIIFSNIVNHCMSKYYLPTMLLFIGLIIGGTVDLKDNINLKNKNNFIIFILTVICMLFISSLAGKKEIIFERNISTYISLVLSGLIDAFATVVPGISGTALLMIYGYYNIIIEALGNITNFKFLSENLFILSAYSMGMLIGIIIFCKIINYLFKHQKEKTYASILGFAVSTIMILFHKTINVEASIYEILISLFLLCIGYFLSKKLND